MRITPPLSDDFVERDFELCRRLVTEVFDAEKLIPRESSERLVEFANMLQSQERLDLLLLYLRRVHAYCFYCGEEYDDERMLASKCGPQHIRNASKLSKDELESSDKWSGSKSFVDKYVKAAREKLNAGPRELASPDQDKILISMKQQYAEKKT